MSTQKVVLVTGVSSGIGRATAQLLGGERGYRVFGASRSAASAGEIPGVEMLTLDVCSDTSVSACIGAVAEKAGRLDVLVNNAGYMLEGAIEETTIEEAKAQFDTNFFGVMRMVRAALPLMRRQGDGQIINISSVGGFCPVPFYGLYTASKHAIEAYSEALRHEVKPFNIRVSLVQPGVTGTNLLVNTKHTREALAEYAPWRKRLDRTFGQGFEKASPPSGVAQAILGLVTSESPRLRTLASSGARQLAIMRWALPAGLFEQGARRSMKLDSKD